MNREVLTIILLSIFSMSAFGLPNPELPLKNYHMYIYNKSEFPIVVNIVECGGVENNKIIYACGKSGLDVEIPGKSALDVGDSIRNLNEAPRKFFAVASISNNITTKIFSTEIFYSDNTRNNNEVHCYNEIKKKILIIDDYDTIDQLFCYTSDFSGVK